MAAGSNNPDTLAPAALTADQMHLAGQLQDFVPGDPDRFENESFSRYWWLLLREMNAAFAQRDMWRHYHPGRFWGPQVESGTMSACSRDSTLRRFGTLSTACQAASGRPGGQMTPSLDCSGSVQSRPPYLQLQSDSCSGSLEQL